MKSKEYKDGYKDGLAAAILIVVQSVSKIEDKKIQLIATGLETIFRDKIREVSNA